MRLPFVVAALALSASRADAQWSTNYFNDYNAGSFWSFFAGISGGSLNNPTGLGFYGPRAGCTSGVYCTPSLGRAGAGWDNSATTLSLFGLGAHTKARVSFSLLLWDSWDGTTGCGGACAPDYFQFKADGSSLLDKTFSNFYGGDQSYGPGTSNPSFTGATEVGTLGPSPWHPGSSVYNLSFEFMHSSSTLSSEFSARGLQGWGDEGWTLDNLRIETYREPASVVPEPGTYALLATGLVGVFGLARRRRA